MPSHYLQLVPSHYHSPNPHSHLVEKAQEHCSLAVMIFSFLGFSTLLSRANLWRSALGFYKSFKCHPERLQFKIQVEFKGEKGNQHRGLDSFRILNGKLTSSILKVKHSTSCLRKSNLNHFEMVGMILYHSIMPCFCLLLRVFHCCLTFLTKLNSLLK